MVSPMAHQLNHHFEEFVATELTAGILIFQDRRPRSTGDFLECFVPTLERGIHRTLNVSIS